MDIVYIYRAGWNNCAELKYSLRWLKNITNFTWKVFLVGYKPDWMSNEVIHIPAEDPFQIKMQNALHKITLACSDSRISEDFILMNDDFFFLKPTEVVYWNQGTINDHINKRSNSWKWGSEYWHWLVRTGQLFPSGLDFSLHRPIIYNKRKFKDLFYFYDFNDRILLRNTYCNHYKIVWEYAEDYKTNSFVQLMEDKPEIFSTGDWIINDTRFVEYMEKLFPEKSIYEL